MKEGKLDRKVYFAGSISGGQQDTWLYKKIIDLLKSWSYRVLSEHIGNPALVVGASIPGLEWEWLKTPQGVYNQDTQWIREADLIIAEVSTPSLGVGYELGLAESLGKRIICLYRIGATKRLTAMVSGNPNLEIIYYTDLEHLEKQLMEQLI